MSVVTCSQCGIAIPASEMPQVGSPRCPNCQRLGDQLQHVVKSLQSIDRAVAVEEDSTAEQFPTWLALMCAMVTLALLGLCLALFFNEATGLWVCGVLSVIGLTVWQRRRVATVLINSKKMADDAVNVADNSELMADISKTIGDNTEENAESALAAGLVTLAGGFVLILAFVFIPLIVEYIRLLPTSAHTIHSAPGRTEQLLRTLSFYLESGGSPVKFDPEDASSLNRLMEGDYGVVLDRSNQPCKDVRVVDASMSIESGRVYYSTGLGSGVSVDGYSLHASCHLQTDVTASAGEVDVYVVAPGFASAVKQNGLSVRTVALTAPQDSQIANGFIYVGTIKLGEIPD